MERSGSTLAARLGLTVHVSPLRRKLRALWRRYPSHGASCLEDWLMDVAHARGARIVIRPMAGELTFHPPSPAELSNEELVVAICQPQGLDRPQMLRLAAQLISRQAVNSDALRLVAERERATVILTALARQALRVAPDHPLWQALAALPSDEPVEPILHWTRLAEPVMKDGRCNAASWRLVA